MPNILKLAKILDLPITKTSSKTDIFKLITQYVELLLILLLMIISQIT